MSARSSSAAKSAFDRRPDQQILLLVIGTPQEAPPAQSPPDIVTVLRLLVR